MRKNSPRKWLHAVLDLLPVLIIPLFMIYSSNKNYQSNIALNITTDIYEEINYNQWALFTDNNIPTSSGEGVIFSSSDGYTSCSVSGTATSNTDRSGWFGLSEVQGNAFDDNVGHTIYCEVTLLDGSYTGNFSFSLFGSSNVELTSSPSWYVQVPNTLQRRLKYTISNGSTFTDLKFTIKCFDLTEMFGIDMPNFDVIQSIFDEPYYPYSQGTVETIVIGQDVVIYDDTDIGSQMFYTLYNTVDKYFNMGNVFNLNGVYDWFNANIFHSSAPLSVYVVWQIVLYELVMDLLFLLYSLFMWFIDMIQKLMEKPLNSIK